MKKTLAVVSLAVVGMAGHSQSVIWDWSYNYVSGTYDYDMSGTFTTADTTTYSGISGNTGYLITGFTGSITSPSVYDLSLGNPGSVYSIGGPESDNLILATGNSGQLDSNGIELIWVGYPDYPTGLLNTDSGVGFTDYAYSTPYEYGDMTITPETPLSTPEPGTMALAGVGAAALLAFRRRK